MNEFKEFGYVDNGKVFYDMKNHEFLLLKTYANIKGSGYWTFIWRKTWGESMSEKHANKILSRPHIMPLGDL